MALTEFGKAIRKARLELDITLGAMSEDLGVTPPFLSGLETGRKKIPSEWVSSIQMYFLQKGINLRELGTLADIANKSVSLEGLDPKQQMLVAGFARSSFDPETLALFTKLLKDAGEGENKE